MAASFQRMSGDARRHPTATSSNLTRFENRAPMPNILCRNGPQCRKYQEGTCNYNHDFTSLAPNGHNGAKKSLNVESPAFTPKLPNAVPVKGNGMSAKIAAVPNFTPRGSSAGAQGSSSHSKDPSTEFGSPPQALLSTPQFHEFVPGQTFVTTQLDGTGGLQEQLAAAYGDPYLSQQLQQTLNSMDPSQQQLNPYTQSAAAVSGQSFFQDTNSYKYPLNYHLYASIGPRRERMLPYQRAAADFFICDTLREDLQRKSEAALQSFATSALPQSVEHFHSLVNLDTNNQKGSSIFGYPSWVYKATSAKDGRVYALRRIEGFRLTNESAIRTIQAWKKINNASVVQIHDAFTGRWFGDSSLIIVMDYHPLAQTVAEKFIGASRPSTSHRNGSQSVTEHELWGYIVQLGNALGAIHDAGLSSQVINTSKVIVTAKNRLRINCCGVLDIVGYEQRQSPADLQRSDLRDLGCLILSIATRTTVLQQGMEKALQSLSRNYSERMRACLVWLIETPAAQQVNDYNIRNMLSNITDKVMAVFDSNLQHEDTLSSELMRELENGRVVRLLTKLNVILERPELSSASQSSGSTSHVNQPSSAWSETGERYYLKLFRDYVFHQVDHEGRPVLDLGHIITCLNKLDAGIDEKIQLVSRDEQNCFIVSFREVKRGFESAWVELSKASAAASRR